MKKIVTFAVAFALMFTLAPAASAAPSKSVKVSSVQYATPNFPTVIPASPELPQGGVIMPKRQPKCIKVVDGPRFDPDLQAWRVDFEVTKPSCEFADGSDRLWYASPFPLYG